MAKKKKSINLLNGASLQWDLVSESDIGCAVIAGEHLNYELLRLISEKVTDKKILEAQLDGNGMLSNFSSRIHFAYQAGLISVGIFHDLQIIKKIRNEFAHTERRTTFEDEEILELCSKFKNAYFGNNSRARFCSVVSYIAAMINMSHKISKKFEQSPYWKTAEEDTRMHVDKKGEK